MPSSRTAARHRRWSVPLHGAPDHSLGRETLDIGSGADSEQPDHWQTALGDHDLLALSSPVQPRAQVGSQLANGDFHNLDRTAWRSLNVRRQPAEQPRPALRSRRRGGREVPSCAAARRVTVVVLARCSAQGEPASDCPWTGGWAKGTCPGSPLRCSIDHSNGGGAASPWQLMVRVEACRR